jgi:hypothetical protein
MAIWAAAWIPYPGQTTDAGSSLAQKNGRNPYIGPPPRIQIDMGDLLELPLEHL